MWKEQEKDRATQLFSTPRMRGAWQAELTHLTQDKISKFRCCYNEMLSFNEIICGETWVLRAPRWSRTIRWKRETMREKP